MLLVAALSTPDADAAGIFGGGMPSPAPAPQGRTFVVYAFTEGKSAYVGHASLRGNQRFSAVMSDRYPRGVRPGWNSRAIEHWLRYYSGNVPAKSGPAYREAALIEQDYMDQYESRGYKLANQRRAVAKPKPTRAPRQPGSQPRGLLPGGGGHTSPPISCPPHVRRYGGCD